MKKTSKKTKSVLSLALIGAIGTSFAFTSPGSVSAAQSNPIQTMAQEQQNQSISDWKTPFIEAGEILKRNNNGYSDYTVKDAILQQVHQTSVEADGSPTITDSSNLFVGRTTLTNNTNQDQTLTTNEFSKTFENSVTNSTTHGFNLGVTASATFKIPLIGETGVEISTAYDFSSTEEKSKSESYTYTASAQNIVVPANSAVEVIVSLNTAKISGNVKLLSKVSGQVLFERSTGSQIYYNFGALVSDASRYQELSNLRTVDSNDSTKYTQAYLVGNGKYSAEYGTEFAVTVRPVVKPNKSSAKLSESTNEGYTYTVKPEVKKSN